MKRLLSIVLVITVLFTCSVVSFASGTAVNGCNWMSVISDSTNLADISMPGTHDTAATYVAFGLTARTQDKTIPAQLNCGARFFDIRLTNENGKLKLVHNFISCRKGSGFTAPKLYFSDAVKYCTEFLNNNPQECIVMFIKRDSGKSAGFDELVLKEIENSKDYWYTENRIPNLGEVRGKIVLMNRFSESDTKLTDANGGINLTRFPDHSAKEGSFSAVAIDSFGGSMISTFTVQDRFKYPKADKWEKAILPTLEFEKVEGGLLINFLSTASGISPEINAKYINENVIGYSFDENRCYGAVLFDFIDEELAAKIYRCNASVTDAGKNPASSVESEIPKPQHGLIKFLDGLWSKIIAWFSK